MKLLFYIPGLVDGGAERVIANLANWFAANGYDVSLVVDFEAGQNSPTLSPKVKGMQLSDAHLDSIRQLAKVITDNNPDIVISAIASANFKLVSASLLAKAKGLAKPGARKRTAALVLTYHGFEEYKTGKLSWLGYKNLPVMSRYAARVIAVSDQLLENLAEPANCKIAASHKASRTGYQTGHCTRYSPDQRKGCQSTTRTRDRAKINSQRGCRNGHDGPR